MILAWITGLLRLRGKTLVTAACGVAAAVALLALLGLHVSHSAATMSARAVALVAPDWQVQLQGTSDAEPAVAAIQEVADKAPLQLVDYADIKSLTAQTGGTTQTTGAGKAIGLDPGYFTLFPRQFRLLAGSLDGPLLAQQTAANLHAAPGDRVTIDRLGAPAVPVTVAGIVEMPSADQFFQVVGATGRAAPTAPPDNVILLPAARWRDLFETQLDAMPQTAARQIHASIDHGRLAADPVAAYVDATGLANNLSARLAGEGVIADNLAARLDGVRLDALFAKVLFLFLGLPGAVVALVLTMLIVSSAAQRRRQEIALLQMRGASPARGLLLVGIEALITGGLGGAVGLILAWLVAALLALPAGLDMFSWYVAAAAAGLIAALLIFLIPAAAAMRRS
ncbi:MAG TPA: FtsX-like permease family protein, partial [Nordella sp.]|nr:FtsX-like permease family protein [Nordella sp.]